MPNSLLAFDFNPTLLIEAPEYEPIEQSALPKSKYTYQLEEVCRRLMSREPFFVREPMNLVFGQDSYNFEEILLHANLQHLVFNALDFRCYLDFVNSRSHPTRPSLSAENLSHYERSVPGLNFAEMCAINIYTGGSFSDMNRFLRRDKQFFSLSLDKISSIIVDTLICCSGLSKIPNTEITETFRVETIPTSSEHSDYLQKRIQAFHSHATISLEGFVSTSVGAPIIGGDILYIFRNLKGKYIKTISQCPGENEYLIPPTQIQIEIYDNTRTDPRYRRYKHRFEVSTIINPQHLSEQSVEMPNLNFLKIIILNKIQFTIAHIEDLALKNSLITSRFILQNTYCYAHLMSFNAAINDYLNAQSGKDKSNILRTQIIPIISSMESESTSQPGFVRSILAQPVIKPIAIIGLFIGLAALSIGSAGLAAGVIGLSILASALLTCLGAVLSLGSCLTLGGSFFSSKPLPQMESPSMLQP